MSERRPDTAILVAAAALLLILLAGGLFFVARQAASLRSLAAAEHGRAAKMAAQVREEAARAEMESRGSGEPAATASAPNPAVKVSLDEAAATLDQSPPSDPAAAASLHAALARSYLALGELDSAERQFTAALVIHTKVSGENSPEADADRDGLAKVAAARSP